MVTSIMERPEVKPYWFQIPMLLSNATSQSDQWLHCWNPDEEHLWMRPHWPGAITENIYGTDRFKKLFGAIACKVWEGQPACWLSGVRSEESPERKMAMTSGSTWKGETWGKMLDKKVGQITMYPIYDWSYTDVWHAIETRGWRYCRLYDYMYQYGVNISAMRVSNVHHETAVRSLFYLQEIEPHTYERLTQRIHGIDTAGKLNMADFVPKKLPFMFKDWIEYRDHLLENMILREDWREAFRRQFKSMEWAESGLGDRLFKVEVKAILTNDFEGTAITGFKTKNYVHALRKQYRLEGKPTNPTQMEAARNAS
jgi:predicted phosphoadenosine phosphosulfate sulfurtransferase